TRVVLPWSTWAMIARLRRVGTKSSDKNVNLIGWASGGQQLLERPLRPRADMGDHLGRGKAADPPAIVEVPAVRVAEQEPRGVEVAGPRRVDHPIDGRGVDDVELAVGEHDRALLAARQRRDGALPARRLEGRVEILDLPERAELDLVREQDVDMFADQLAELRPMAADAERVGEAERHLAPGLMGDRSRLAEGLLGARRVPQIALQIGDLGARDQGGIDVFRSQLDAGAEMGLHRAL